MLSVNFTVQIQFIAVLLYVPRLHLQRLLPTGEVTATATNFLSFILIILIIFLV